MVLGLLGCVRIAARPLGSLTWLIFGERQPKYDAIWHDELRFGVKQGDCLSWIWFSRAPATDLPQASFARWHSGYVQQVLHKHNLELRSWRPRCSYLFVWQSHGHGQGCRTAFARFARGGRL